LGNLKRNFVRQKKLEQPKTKEWIRPLGFLLTVGWYVGLSLLVPIGIGFWLDRPEQLNSSPLYTLIGFGIGTIIAFYGLYRMLRRFYNEQKNRQAKT
jgi:hypothetical protein